MQLSIIITFQVNFYSVTSIQTHQVAPVIILRPFEFNLEPSAWQLISNMRCCEYKYYTVEKALCTVSQTLKTKSNLIMS